MRRSESTRGFSLPELMIVIVIAGIMAAATVPPLMSVLRTNRIEAGVNELAISLRSARSKAVAQGNNFVWTYIQATRMYATFDDDNSNGVREGGEILYGPARLPQEVVRVSVTLPTVITFRPLGNVSSGGYIEFSDGRGALIRLTVESATGMVSVSQRQSVDIDS